MARTYAVYRVSERTGRGGEEVRAGEGGEGGRRGDGVREKTTDREEECTDGCGVIYKDIAL